MSSYISDIMKHYVHILMNTNFTYGRGKSRWLWLGYKHFWELGRVSQIKEDIKCGAHGTPRSRTPANYVVRCYYTDKMRIQQNDRNIELI